jgi:hypothetical protein
MEASETKAIQELRAALRQFTEASEELQRIQGEAEAKGGSFRPHPSHCSSDRRYR